MNSSKEFKEIMAQLEAKTIKKRSNKHKRKAVKCIETGVIYVSSSDAADILSAEGNIICPRCILAVCQGRQKTAGKLHWAYA
jgi:hypothetical protein